MCLHDEENRIEKDNDQVDLERSMLISNPEMWKELYGKDIVPEGPGTVIRYPTTQEDFEVMIEEWEGTGFQPDEPDALNVSEDGYSHLLTEHR